MIEVSEVDTLLNVLRGELRDATTGLYAEKKWARSVEVLIIILDEWRQARQSSNASDLDGPVWSAEQMNGLRRAIFGDDDKAGSPGTACRSTGTVLIGTAATARTVASASVAVGSSTSGIDFKTAATER